MKNKALLAEYQIEGEPLSKAGFDLSGIENDHYMVDINGNKCKVIISHELGDTHLSVNVHISETEARLPTYDECLKVKDIFFEEDETVVFGISNNKYNNMIINNPYNMHMYKYYGPMPPIKKIIEIDNYKIDGDYKITKGKGWGWRFIKISGEHYPDMDEIRQIKYKYAPYMDVAVFLIKNAVILFNNPKDGITVHFQKIK